MTIREKLVVIGCDDAHALPLIIAGLQENYPFTVNFISAIRELDLINITKTLNPAMVILCFRDNLAAVKNFEFYVNSPQTPLLCLMQQAEDETMFWSDTNIVFTYQRCHLANKEYFSSRIRSIFQLSATPAVDFVTAPLPIPGDQPEEHDRNLSRYVMELEQKKEVLMRIKDRITELFPSVDDQVRTALVSITNTIKLSYSDNRIWEDFKVYFEKTDPHFLSVLSEKHPSLTSKDLKYCCYLKMNMSNDDIRDLLGINQESVRTHKYRLKKKMALGKEQDLRRYVCSVGHSEPVVIDLQGEPILSEDNL